MRKIVIGVMGPEAGASECDRQNAYELGQHIAQAGWVLLTGGRNTGVMDASSKGAKAANGLTVGILPTADDSAISDAVDIPIITGMGSARNNINVLSSDVVIACGMGAGTASEVALALKANKPIVLLTNHQESQLFFKSLSDDNIFFAATPEVAIQLVKEALTRQGKI
ncbi:MAG: TIGR00725 family protein [Cyanobacteriota bacterium]